MREIVTNQFHKRIIITEEGIHLTAKGKSVIISRERITKPLKFSLIYKLSIATAGETYSFVADDIPQKKALSVALDVLNPLIGKPVGRELTDADFGIEPPKPVEIIPDSQEFRMHCKVCGHVYCYTMAEYKENERLKKEVNSKELSGALSTLFTSMSLGSSQNQEAEMMKMRIKDFTRCPKCNSADIHELAEGEMPPATEKSAPSAASPMDELKKLKELLDMGIVTQEEFDAKKKQLLGL